MLQRRWSLLARFDQPAMSAITAGLGAKRTSRELGENDAVDPKQTSRCRVLRFCALLGFDVRGPDHLGPLFGFLSEQLSEIGRRTAKHRSIQFCKFSLERGIDERGVDLFVKAVDDFGRSVFGHTDAKD